MAVVGLWLKQLETRTLVWLARSRMSSVVIAGTLAAAGLSAGLVSAHPSKAVQQAQPGVAVSTTSMSMVGDCPGMDAFTQ